MANRMINCVSCNQSVKSAVLNVIGGKAFCGRCLEQVQIKGTEITGCYYMHLKDRIFVEYWDGRDRVIGEFSIKDINFGGVSEIYRENSAGVRGFIGLD
jgi:hypothetical protein